MTLETETDTDKARLDCLMFIIFSFPDKDTLFRRKFRLVLIFLTFRVASKELEFPVILLKILRVSEDLSVPLFV